ncbi:MAG: hypothetical protein QXV32_03120 [Conexivisphaerales archaeon]
MGLIFQFTAAEVIGTALAFSALISFLMLRFGKERTVEISIQSQTVRLYKYQKASIQLVEGGRNSSWLRRRIHKVNGPAGVKAVGDLQGGEITISVQPLYAGLFEGFEFGIEVKDPLGLFYVLKYFELPLVIESLPSSLLSSVRKYVPETFSTGERPSGKRGMGHEIYSVENYTNYSTARDIMWKRVAKQSDEKILVGVREASTPETISILVAELNAPASVEAKLVWKDLVCEALARITIAALSMGSRVDVFTPSSHGEAERMEDVSDMIMSIWRPIGRQYSEVSPQLAIVPLSDVNEYFRKAGKLIVIPTDISNKLISIDHSPDIISFTGTEEIESLLESVMA